MIPFEVPVVPDKKQMSASRLSSNAVEVVVNSVEGHVIVSFLAFGRLSISELWPSAWMIQRISVSLTPLWAVSISDEWMMMSLA